LQHLQVFEVRTHVSAEDEFGDDFFGMALIF
jgi:hypothetical protein